MCTGLDDISAEMVSSEREGFVSSVNFDRNRNAVLLPELSTGCGTLDTWVLGMSQAVGFRLIMIPQAWSPGDNAFELDVQLLAQFGFTQVLSGKLCLHMRATRHRGQE